MVIGISRNHGGICGVYDSGKFFNFLFETTYFFLQGIGSGNDKLHFLVETKILVYHVLDLPVNDQGAENKTDGDHKLQDDQTSSDLHIGKTQFQFSVQYGNRFEGSKKNCGITA